MKTHNLVQYTQCHEYKIDGNIRQKDPVVAKVNYDISKSLFWSVVSSFHLTVNN